MLPHFAKSFTKEGSIVEIFETSHGVILLFNRSMILLHNIVFVFAGAVFDFLTQHFSNGFWVGVVLVGCNLFRFMTGRFYHLFKEGFGCRQITGL